MAWIVADSFDYYASIADTARSVWDSVNTAGNLQPPASTRFGVGQALGIAGPPVLYVKTLASNEATLYLALAYYRPAALPGGTGAEVYWQLRDGATAQCTVCFDQSGNITLKSGGPTGTILATYAGAFSQDTWTHFQVRVVVDAAAGSMTVRKNGQASDTYASATTLNTRGGTANNYANAIALGSQVNPTSSNRVDDLLCFSGSGVPPNTWIGDVRALCLMPSADTAQKQFTVFPSGTNAGAVDEALANGDTDYVFDSTVGDSDLYDVTDLPTTPASVIGVVSKIYIKKSDAGARSGQVLLSSGGTQVAGTDTVLSTTYVYLARVDAVDPATGVAWTPAAVNALKLGQKVTA
jgi:hypothetical protein